MTHIAQPDIRENIVTLDINAYYLTSKPAALLEQVETTMLQALQSATHFSITGSDSIQEAALYHLRSGGQRLRARLALGAAQAIGLKESDCITIAAAIELLHNASLIHDDLQDGDQYRRGNESVWSKFSKNLAICCGDLYLSTSYATLANISHTAVLPALFQLVHKRVAEAVLGQCADLTITPEQITLNAYIEVVKAKSGALLSLPMEMVFTLGGQDNYIDLAKQACMDFAVGFQIYDDLRDMNTDVSQESGIIKGPERLNIVSIFTNLNHGLIDATHPVTAAKLMALEHLQRSEDMLSTLPTRSGLLLQECCINIRCQLNELI